MAFNKVNGIVLKIPRVRLSFPDLFVARSLKSDPTSKPRFGVSAILDPKFPPHKKALEEITAEIERLKREGWPKGPPRNLKVEFLNRGDDVTNNQTGDPYEGYAGMMILRANSNENQPPHVTGRDKRDLKAGDPAIYPGVYAHFSCNLYITETGGTPRICCGLRAVQSLEHGDPLSGRVVTDKEFEDFEDYDDGEGDDGL